MKDKMLYAFAVVLGGSLWLWGMTCVCVVVIKTVQIIMS